MAGTRLSKEIKKDYLKGIGGGKKKNKTREIKKKISHNRKKILCDIIAISRVSRVYRENSHI
jgi:hypothetical protein